MLQENEDVISFHPGSRKNGQAVLGRIVVHDRARVESEVLPRYFNHASFASLRRQLNYFSFTRIGKGRQRGATYCNEAVIDLYDILRLKRRAAGTATPQEEIDSSATVVTPVDQDPHESSSNSSACGNDKTEGPSATVNAVVPVVHLPPKRSRSTELPTQPKTADSQSKNKKARRSGPNTAPVSPLSSSGLESDPEVLAVPPVLERRQITLDLTVPYNPSEHKYVVCSQFKPRATNVLDRDEDILAGCNALLSFSNRTVGTM
mmetsp:Transcript_27021/g.62786  ORF Transcript_27021/g.62786 Transcript_27021/m.62786 type:complete len:262 (+) Transcript_27021:586-1371(+)